MPSSFSCSSMEKYLCLLIYIASCIMLPVSGKVFVSIDCGASGSFTDENTIVWKGDTDLISNGVTRTVQSNYTVSRVMDTLRVFTTRKKNCYSIDATQGEKVLVRAGFNYGNYDKMSSPPTFDLQFNGNFWVTVNASASKMYEAIYVVKSKFISVCVAQTKPNQFPFISTLEVRSLESQMYNNIGTNYALLMNQRIAYGINESTRFPMDPYDRIWSPIVTGTGLLNVRNAASSFIDTSDMPDNPPQAVLRNAISAPDINHTIILGVGDMSYPIHYPAYLNWFFSEVESHNPAESRAFRILMDNLPYSLPISLRFRNVTSYFISNLTITLNTTFTIYPIGISTLPPIVNAVEHFSISDALTDGTNKNDVEGLSSLQNAFDILQEWGGDPCLPAPYSWEWIVCSNDPTPRVTSIKLDSFNLSGPLPNFSNMDALEILDLHNNSLTGSIPSFLGALPKLKQLNLANNQFSGSIPKSLLRNSKLNFIYTGNTLLCTKGKSCPGSDENTTTKLPIILGICIPVLLLLGAIVGVLVIRHKRRKVGFTRPSGVTGHRANDLYSGTRGTTSSGDNYGKKGVAEVDENTDERFYRSPTPLLGERRG